MSWGYTKKAFGVCGNFRFAFIDLTDIKATRSVVKPEGFNSIKFVCTTNTSDKQDVLLGKTLNWAGTAVTDLTYKIDTNGGEVFDPRINGLQVFNSESSDALEGVSGILVYDSSDTDQLYIFNPDTGAAYDLFPDGNEDFSIVDERSVQVLAADAGDDGTMFIMGD